MAKYIATGLISLLVGLGLGTGVVLIWGGSSESKRPLLTWIYEEQTLSATNPHATRIRPTLIMLMPRDTFDGYQFVSKFLPTHFDEYMDIAGSTSEKEAIRTRFDQLAQVKGNIFVYSNIESMSDEVRAKFFHLNQLLIGEASRRDRQLIYVPDPMSLSIEKIAELHDVHSTSATSKSRMKAPVTLTQP